ncbi:MAG: TM1812 family CRISPR-associated protein [Prevotella sp.]|nr:TM1812 family CRISPR-associated protein [Prevotella sp.]
MARRVFISFLGTNNYVECIYKYNGILSEPVRFVQEALISHICKDWTEKDKIIIFCTSKESTGMIGSKEINWLDNGTSSSGVWGLEHRLKKLHEEHVINTPYEQIDIESGFTEDEIWKIFNTVYKQLLPSDQIFFDVTHAFRSIPLFSVVLFNYSKFMIGTHLSSIMYGAFEKIGPSSIVREMPLEKRIAPIIDLTNIARLQEYNQIASGLKDFGKVKPIKNIITNDQSETADHALKELEDAITELDEYITTIDLKSIKSGKFITKFRNNYKFVKRKMKFAEPIMNILEELNKETSDFVSEDSFRNIEASINWTIKHDMLMQTFPLTEEYIILRVANILKDMRPKQLSSKRFRMFTSSILGMPEEDFNLKNWKDTLAEYPDVADDMSEDFLIKEIRPKYDEIRTARNSLAHGNGSVKYDDLKKLIPTIIDCIEYVNAEYKKYPSTIYIIKTICC